MDCDAAPAAALPHELERSIALLCENTRALALVNKSWLSAALACESHEPLSANGSTWCPSSAAKNGAVRMPYLSRVDLTLQGVSRATLVNTQAIWHCLDVALQHALAARRPLSIWVSTGAFKLWPQLPQMLACTTWQTFLFADYDVRVEPFRLDVNARDVHACASLMSRARFGPALRHLTVMEDPRASWLPELQELEAAAVVKAFQYEAIESLTLCGLMDLGTAEALYKATSRFSNTLKPLPRLRRLVLMYATRAPWSRELGVLLRYLCPALTDLKIYGSNLLLKDLEVLALHECASLQSLNLEGNYTLIGLPGELQAYAGLQSAGLAHTGIKRPPAGFVWPHLEALTCDYSDAWAPFLGNRRLKHVKLSYQGLFERTLLPTEELQHAERLELDLRDFFNRARYIAEARRRLPNTLVVQAV